ncbi:hypothetical protein DY000_02015902 [Brassica cretica]|uniref:Uncharacterized protein n=1 Tax=Brassica cretica TaxID=69181 RepID=A0ABQ7CWY5_BRACR|nr:hypothetical protein DY000_02015902 [Brassica cretica]
MDFKKKYHVFYDKWLKLKDKNLRLLQDQAHSRKHGVSQKARQDQSKLVDKLAAVKEMNNASKSEGKEAYQEVRRDVRQRVRPEVKRVAVSDKPKLVHQCTNMKVRQDVLKHGCAAGTRKETDRFISNCVRPNKKQHRLSCWFCEKIGRKKVECLVREKRRNSAQKLNKVFIEPMRVEKVCIAKCALLDEIKEETPKVGCDFLT